MADDPTVADREPAGAGDADLDVLLDLLAVAADRGEVVDSPAGAGPVAQENRAIHRGRAHLAQADARRTRAGTGEVRRRARSLARAADLERGRSRGLGPARTGEAPRDRATLTGSDAVDAAVRPGNVADRLQNVVDGARRLTPEVCWAQLTSAGRELTTWTSGELSRSVVAALEEGPRAAVLGGADTALSRQGGRHWPTTPTDGVRSVLALATTRGALVLASTGLDTFDDATRVVAGRLAARADALLAGADAAPSAADRARDLLDGACAVLGRHLRTDVGAALEALVEAARVTDASVLDTADRVLDALVVVPGAVAVTAAPPVPEPGVVRLAASYMEDRAADDITVDDIAAAAGIGLRGLQIAFRRHRGVTPMQYLRAVRLERAHAELDEAPPSSPLTVGAVAARWHFGNPGRFSVTYRERFGRSPSRTLRA